MRRQFNQALLPLYWDKKMNNGKRNKFNSKFSIWFFSVADQLKFERKELIQFGIASGKLTKWFNCNRYPHIQNMSKVCMAISKLTGKNYHELLSECLKQVGYFR
tara:strand:+ start:3307 stop:3618 length:312 start_codon:yes stop_codon:yes gene_type:complete